jgi:hypothetical protein
MIRKTLVLLSLLVSTHVYGDGLYLDYERYIQDGRDSLIYPSPHKEKFSFNLDIRLTDWLFLNSSLYTVTSGQEFMGAGSDSKLGVEFPSKLQLFYHHRSEHCLDRQCDRGFYPVYDSIGIRIPLMAK